jgi:long-chain-fatty-acid--CoA ligase ACSBG
MGAIYAAVIPTGIYITNNSETCLYIAEHSEAGCLVLDSLEQFNKYAKDLNKLKSLKAIVFYCELTEEQLKSMVNPYVPVYQWKDFIELGRKANVDLEFNDRVRMQKPGNCSNIVYTSGTTGQPKAVLLSHDNMTWLTRSLFHGYKHMLGQNNKIVSFLPLSHIAAQIMDLYRKYFLIKSLLFPEVKFILLVLMLLVEVLSKQLNMLNLAYSLLYLEFMRKWRIR